MGVEQVFDLNKARNYIAPRSYKGMKFNIRYPLSSFALWSMLQYVLSLDASTYVFYLLEAQQN